MRKPLRAPVPTPAALPVPAPAAAGVPVEMSTRLTLLLAAACGLIVANLYYAQPLIGPIRASLELSPGAAGLVVTMTQLGYGLGLLLLVPLGDLLENRGLVVVLLLVAALALLGVALSATGGVFFAAALAVGFSSVAAQVLVPYAAHLAPEAVRGRAVGNVMSGLLLGIMLARPMASLIAGTLSWHVVFLVSAVLMVGLAGVLRATLPPRHPAAGPRYGALLRSMGQLARRTPVLQRRAAYQFFLFGAFSLFWTAAPLLLADKYRLSQNGIALFALAGVAGAVSAPLAGRAADRSWGQAATAVGMLAAVAAFVIGRFGASGSENGLFVLTTAAIVLDFGVAANNVLGQRAIFSLGAGVRSRLNGLYLAVFFGGGAVGSALGAWSYAKGGWPLTSSVGLAMPVLALGCFLTEFRQKGRVRDGERGTASVAGLGERGDD